MKKYIKAALFSFIFVQVSAQLDTCFVQPYAERSNLGLYGGSSLDLTFCNTSARLFATSDKPFSLVYSDDTAQTWQHAFSDDSLSYECGERGWGGGGSRVLSNIFGWTLSLTSHAVVVSYACGDSGTWKTLADSYILNQMGYQEYGPTDITITGLNVFAALGPYIIRSDNILITPDVIDISGFFASYPKVYVRSLAANNSIDGYPLYMVVDSTMAFTNQGSDLYKFDGSTMNKVSLPLNVQGVLSVFMPTTQTSGDTVFINAYNSILKNIEVYRTFDGGSSWNQLSNTNSGSYLQITDVDFSALWTAMMPQSYGVVITQSGQKVSKDFGTTWQKNDFSESTGLAIHPYDTSVVIKSLPLMMSVSKTGVSGNYNYAVNNELDAIQINKITKTENDSVAYLATPSGLAYTGALSLNIDPEKRWKTPYGTFPIDSIDIYNSPFGTNVVAINPDNSQHVIADMLYGFALTTTGHEGFTPITTTMAGNDPQINDIAFINNSVILAVTGGQTVQDTGKGNIWRSADGGLNWNKIHPNGFTSGNVIAVGYADNTTVIYIGTGIPNANIGYLWRSDDVGLTWKKINEGPSVNISSPSGMAITDIVIDPRSNDTLLVAASGYDATTIVKTTDGYGTYQYINHSLIKLNVSSLEINMNYPDTIYFASESNIMVYDAVNDTSVLNFRGYPHENINDLAYGSLLCATSTGFYNILLDPYDDIVSNSLAYHPYNYFEDKFSYPNPATDFLFINTEKLTFLQDENEVSVSILDMTGHCISRYSFSISALEHRTNAKIPIHYLTSGIYIVEINFSEQKNIIEKVVIQN